MSSIRNIKHVLAVLAIASLAAFGCSKDEKKEAGGAEKAAGGKQEGGAGPAAGKGAFAIFPKDTNLVIGINVAEISASNLYKQFVEPQIKAQADKEFAEFKAECGFDPVSAVKEVVIGGTMDSQMEPNEDKVILVVKGLTRSQLSDCVQKMSQKEDSGVQISQEGNFTKMTKDNETMWLAWLDDTTMVTGPKLDKAMLEQRLAGTDGLDGNKEMMNIVGNTDQKAGIWLAMKMPEGAEAPADVKFSAAFASLKLAGGLKLDGGIRQGSADEASATVTQAKAMLDQAKTQLGPFAKYLEKIDMSSKGNDVIVKVSLSDAELNEIGPMMGAMMGGGF